MARPTHRILVLALACLVTCSLPARDFGDYLGKATGSADAAISEAETALLAGDLWLRGRLFRQSLAVQLEDAEHAADDAHHGFASVLPPDRRSEALRGVLEPILHETADLIARMRFAARRDDVAGFRRLRGALADSAQRLESWLAHHA
jgi:hypothetical protein